MEFGARLFSLNSLSTDVIFFCAGVFFKSRQKSLWNCMILSIPSRSVAGYQARCFDSTFELCGISPLKTSTSNLSTSKIGHYSYHVKLKAFHWGDFHSTWSLRCLSTKSIRQICFLLSQYCIHVLSDKPWLIFPHYTNVFGLNSIVALRMSPKTVSIPNVRLVVGNLQVNYFEFTYNRDTVNSTFITSRIKCSANCQGETWRTIG